MNYVEFAAIVLGLESKKIEEKNHVFAKIKKDDIFFICNINIDDDVCNKHSITICSKCDVKIRKIKQAKSKEMVHNLKDSASAAAHLWTEYYSEKKMKVIMECHPLQFAPFLQTLCSPYKEAKIGENLNI